MADDKYPRYVPTMDDAKRRAEIEAEARALTAPKTIWESKTLWANAVALAAALVYGVSGIDLGLDAETEAELATGILALVNIGLRVVTKNPVTVTRKKP